MRQRTRLFLVAVLTVGASIALVESCTNNGPAPGPIAGPDGGGGGGGAGGDGFIPSDQQLAPDASFSFDASSGGGGPDSF